ncbi:OsmC family protein [Salinibacterium sp. M195]|uniref:OsmC family protein n=1 Tax=Salinibacterium sp. M195 TaxID=2583374 RepID=UPI001C62C3C7|nr:OsmC family protein [Salinibacterium sp. M195]QYH35793.1 OsmC family protein [Salinibacterium sp. M195]
MTLLTNETTTIDLAADRAARLTAAGEAWNSRIAAKPTTAELTYAVTGKGVGSVGTVLKAGTHVFHIDEPEGLAGDDVAASPVEIALGALIACQVVVFRLYAQALGIQVDDISVKAEGDLDVRGLFGIDDNVRNGFSEIRLYATIAGPETQERYDELRDAVDAHCPVLDLFANPTAISTRVVKG